jgi:hypothetical protein
VEETTVGEVARPAEEEVLDPADAAEPRRGILRKEIVGVAGG